MSENEVVRVLRVLEYVGDRKWVENTLSHSGVPLNGVSPYYPKLKNRGGEGYIKSGMIGSFPEVVQDHVHPELQMIEEVKNMLTNKLINHNYDEPHSGEVWLVIDDILKQIEYIQNNPIKRG